MITLINETDSQHAPYTGISKITIEINSEATLPELLEAFEGFLKASGYHVPEGHVLDIVGAETH